MHRHGTYRVLMLVLVLFVLIAAAACGSATPAPATAVPPTAAPPTAAPALPTATTAAAAAAVPATATLPPAATPTPPPSPTATAIPVPPTETPQPTAAPTLGMAAQDSLTAWCLPEASGFKSATISDVKTPEKARAGEIKDGVLVIKNLPASACAFIYTFNQAAPAGLKLELYDVKAVKPWLVTDLQPVQGSPNSLAAVLYHTYIIAPPKWSVSFEFAVKDAGGTELRRDRVSLNRWTPKVCWNGIYPNPITMRCNAPQDLHPWDPSYLTPIPTFAPGEDPIRGW